MPALPEYSTSPPPDYNVAPVATERVIASTLYTYHPPPSPPPPAPLIDTTSATSPTSPTHSTTINPFRTSLRSTRSASVSSHRPSSANYTVHSNSHILVILPRPDPTSNRSRPLPLLPAYGHRAAVSGSLLLAHGSWTSTISKVAISLEGRASSVLIQRGVREPASSRTLFSVSQTLWKNTGRNAPNLSDKIKFEVRFPQSISAGNGRNTDPPPTFEQETQMAFGIATHVKIEYTLKVDVWRRGLWRHKRLNVPILYLPKTYPAPDRMPLVPRLSLLDAKRFGLESEKWRRVNLSMPRCRSSDEPWSASAALPKETTNPSSRPIPVVIIVSRPAPAPAPAPSTDPTRPPSMSAAESEGCAASSEGHSVPLGPGDAAWKDLFDFKATLIKRVRLHCSKPHPGHSWESDRVLGEAVVRKVTVDTEVPINGRGPRVVTTIYACLNGGVEQGETTWALDGFVHVEYAIRIAISSRSASGCRVQREEPLFITTHGPCDFLDGDPQAPALRLLDH